MMHGHSISDAGDQERGQGYETTQGNFQARMQVWGTTSENCVEVTRRLGLTIQISSGYLRNLARWWAYLHNLLEELV